MFSSNTLRIARKLCYVNNKYSASVGSIVRIVSNNISTTNNFSNKEKDNESPLKKLLDDAASFEDVKPAVPEQQWATLPYLEGTRIRRQGEYFQKIKHDPRNNSIVLFPGQGSQYVGMAKNLLKFPMAKDLFELANYILGYDLLRLCLQGPKDKLDQTKYCQPAVLVCSLAAIERLKEERPNAIDSCVGTAGFSLGEITALIFAGSIGFERGKHILCLILDICSRPKE